jgi:hypothetical protein
MNSSPDPFFLFVSSFSPLHHVILDLGTMYLMLQHGIESVMNLVYELYTRIYNRNVPQTAFTTNP